MLTEVELNDGRKIKVLPSEVAVLKNAGKLKEEKADTVTKEEKDTGETKEEKKVIPPPPPPPAARTIISKKNIKGKNPKKVR